MPRGGGGGGAGRGRGGPARPGMSLDMRPTSLLVSSLPDELANEGALRAHFQSFGDISNVEFPSTSIAVVQFVDRFRAEAAIANGRQYKSHKLQVTWYNPATIKAALSQEQKQPAAAAADAIKEEPVTDDLSSSTASMDQVESEPYGHFDDEEEEDTERSWKH